jgi:hypothetical protein
MRTLLYKATGRLNSHYPTAYCMLAPKVGKVKPVKAKLPPIVAVLSARYLNCPKF